MRTVVAITLAVAFCVSRVAPHMEDAAVRAVRGIERISVREVSERIVQVYQAATLLNTDQK